VHWHQLHLLLDPVPVQRALQWIGRLHRHEPSGRNDVRLSRRLHVLFVWLERTLLGRHLSLHVLLQQPALLLRRSRRIRRRRNRRDHLPLTDGSRSAAPTGLGNSRCGLVTARVDWAFGWPEGC